MPAQNGFKEHRQGHHEPDIPGPKQKEAGRRQAIDRFALAKQLAKRRFLLHLANVCWQVKGGQQGQTK
jgi:hypothetical protein